MPSFCRHNRFANNCPICSREQAEKAAPRQTGVRSSGGHVTRNPRTTSRTTRSRSTNDLRVRRIARAGADGYGSQLVPGIRATADAERLAEELGFASGRLASLAVAPTGLYAEVASLGAAGDYEEATWLAFLIAYVGPLDGEDPWAGISAARTSWASGELPDLTDVPLGPRTSHAKARGTTTIEAYRAWIVRSGTQQRAFEGEPSWTPARRFQRVFERLALKGFSRDARYDLLVTLGRLGLYELSGPSLYVGGDDETTVAAKRVFGIGDTLLLERRAADLAEAAELPIEVLDVGLWNWARPPARPLVPGGRATLGAPASEPDADAYTRAASALGL
ncbi:hypothetical protein Q5424_11960 [Conexibacter sp. JD483]|uniref:alpha-glutamyl/putrescinyl thymine pyrophosphorylase clade 3 protein n=1 Tax=unclassified Conexibacter TaxID=2627773 RepID=UPI00271724AC|nr:MULTISPECIES: hypothetical protein [unclassified Conexibacter]MDO8188034.1 hypothetical protein [Conexibacter sp. CPCC 205706]MDO8200456.1 hypothetical protein [Conexibacter sp. CPCC 205762]MDR9369803.1 hypothetical protein [Conexibacter sp. JD483]